MAERIISGDCHLRLSTTAGAGLGQLRRSRDQMCHEVRIGPGGRPRWHGGFFGVRKRNKGVAQGASPVPKWDIAELSP